MSLKLANTNLRDMEVTGNTGKDVTDTAMFDTNAKEVQDNNIGDNPQKEYIAKDPTPGKLGAFGRC